mgnify:CR=1 FL=1
MDMRFAFLLTSVLIAGGLTVLVASWFAGSPAHEAGLPAVAGLALLLRLLMIRRRG